MVKFTDFEYREKVYLGMVKGEMIFMPDSPLFAQYQERGIYYPLSDAKLLPPVIPTKIASIGQSCLKHIKELGATV